MSSQVSALKRIITKEDHNKYSVILLRNTLNCVTNQLVIGRDNDCNYRITSIEISRKHACIKFDDNNWHITDLQSTNGLFINCIQLKPYTPYCLINGDKISFGPQTHSEFVYQFVTDFNQEIHRLNIATISASLPIIPIRIHTNSGGESSSSSSSSSTVSPPLPSNTVRFNIEPNVSGTISVTAMPTRSGVNYHSTGSAINTTTNDNTSRRERNKKQPETVNNRALVNDHEYSRSAVFIPSSGSSNRRSAKKNKDKQKEMEKKRYEREMEKLRKEKEALEQKKDSERQRIKRKEDALKRWKAELDKKEKETRKKEEEVEKMKKQLSNEQKKLMEERNKKMEKERKDDKESRNSSNSSNSNKKYTTKRKVCDTSMIESKTIGAKRQCNDIIDTNQEQQLEEIFDSELTCTICHELFVHAVNLNCSHTFCFACIEQWKHANNGKRECPICRVEIRNQNRQLVLDNLIERIVIKMKPEQREHREKLVEERKKKLVKQQQHVARRLSNNRGVVSSYPLSSLHVILREATNASTSTSTESDSDSNSDVSSNDEVSVIGIGFAGNYDIQSIVESDSDVSSSAYNYSDDSDSDPIAHHSNAINNFSDDSSIVSLGVADADDGNDNEDNDDDDAHSYVSVSSISETSDISDSSDESSNESDAESIFHIYDSTDLASANSSLNSIFTSV